MKNSFQFCEPNKRMLIPVLFLNSASVCSQGERIPEFTNKGYDQMLPFSATVTPALPGRLWTQVLNDKYLKSEFSTSFKIQWLLVLNTESCLPGDSLGCIFPQAKPTSVYPPHTLSFLCNEMFCVWQVAGSRKRSLLMDRATCC